MEDGGCGLTLVKVTNLKIIKTSTKTPSITYLLNQTICTAD